MDWGGYFEWDGRGAGGVGGGGIGGEGKGEGEEGEGGEGEEVGVGGGDVVEEMGMIGIGV